MAVTYDYTFNNTLIKAFFEGSNNYAPVGELVYVHTHPLVIPNFMTQLSEMIAIAGKTMEKHNIGPYYNERLSEIAIGIGRELSAYDGVNAIQITVSNATAILEHMREAYKLCKDLSSMV